MRSAQEVHDMLQAVSKRAQEARMRLERTELLYSMGRATEQDLARDMEMNAACHAQQSVLAWVVSE